MLGVKADDVLEKELWEVLPINDFTRSLSQAVKASEPEESEQVVVFPPDRVYVAQMIPVESPDGRNSGVVAYLRDMTAVQKIERGLDQFLTDVNAQLKLPLTAIKGYVETLLEGAYQNQEVTKRFLQVINEETNRLTRLVVSLEEAATGPGSEPQKAPTDLLVIIREVAGMFNQVAAEKNLALQLALPTSLPSLSVAGEGMRRVLVNLIDNAVKCTGLKGYGWVKVTVRETPTDVEIVVADSGVGIDPDEQDKVFERFYRVTTGPAAELGGTGLGLAVAQEIVEQHGGSVSVASQVGDGATFTVKLPLP